MSSTPSSRRRRAESMRIGVVGYGTEGRHFHKPFIAAGVHVIADKPFAPNAEGAMELDAAAKTKGVVPGVYQNRRYDADTQTLCKLVKDGRPGRIWRVHSRMDQDGAHAAMSRPASWTTSKPMSSGLTEILAATRHPRPTCRLRTSSPASARCTTTRDGRRGRPNPRRPRCRAPERARGAVDFPLPPRLFDPYLKG